MNSICLISNCNRLCPDTEPFCSVHRDEEPASIFDTAGWMDRAEKAEALAGGAFADGFKTGMLEACRTLHEAAVQHHKDADDSRKVLDTHAHRLAAHLLQSWANGLEINAHRVLEP